MGELFLNTKEMSFTFYDKTVFSSPISEIYIQAKIVRESLDRKKRYTGFAIKIGEKKYNLYYIPHLSECFNDLQYLCDWEGYNLQLLISDYIIKTIQRLAQINTEEEKSK